MISIKKLATVGVAAGLLLGSAMPAFACDGPWWCNGGFLLQKNQGTTVNNTIDAYSNTGGNTVEDNGNITTGSASTTVLENKKVNKNLARIDCGCFNKVLQINKNTSVSNSVTTGADTGWNTVEDNGDITTGSATNSTTVNKTINKNVVVTNQ